MPPDVAVQVVNYRTRRFLEPCLQSVVDDLSGSAFAWNVLVLDNDSGDDLSDLAERWSAAPVEFHRAERNLGFGAAHNRLAAMHDAPALLVLNPDTRIVEDATVARLRRVLDEPGVAAVGPQLHDAAGAVEVWDHGELTGLRARVAHAAGASHHLRRSVRADVAWVSGAAALIDRRWFDAVGGFDPAFFLYKEEEDLFLRIRRRGGRVVYDPSVRVRHDGSVTAARGEHLQASTARFREKHVPSRLRRAVLPPLHRELVEWEGRLRRAHGLLRGRGR